MTAPLDHLHEATACLHIAQNVRAGDPEDLSLLCRATAHGVLAIAERLAPLARLNQDSDHALQVAAWLIADRSRSEAGWLIDRLVRHAKGEHYDGAATLAQAALDATTGREHYAVAQAIITLKIVLPA